MFTAQDHRFMARALRLADTEIISPHPNPRVGCVLVRDNEIIGEGWHVAAGQPHAEVNALAQAADARGATAYVTLEPCSHHGRTPPCADALIAAGVSRVVAAMQDPNPQVAGRGLQRLADAGIEISSGLLESEAARLNRGFIKRMQTGRPFVRAKLAMSLDGRTAMASGESKWISSEDARRDVQRLRARADAMLTGSGTVLADNPSLTLREEQLGEAVTRQPLRVVLDSQLQISADANLLKQPGQTLILTGNQGSRAWAELSAAGAELCHVGTKNGRIDPVAALDELGRRGINEVMVEAGETLNGALLEAQLVDEIVIYLAPHIMGSAAKGLFSLPSVHNMSERQRVDIIDIRAVGCDWRVTARPIY